MSLTLADEPWKPVVVRDGDAAPLVWTPPDPLQEEDTYPKEAQIVRDVQAELAAGRKVWIYTTFTDRHPQADRLAAILRAAGIHPAILTRDVPRDQREAWIADQCDRGVQVVISHPQLVETGLNLLAFPTLFWYSRATTSSASGKPPGAPGALDKPSPAGCASTRMRTRWSRPRSISWPKSWKPPAPSKAISASKGLQRLTEQQGSGNDLARALAHGLDRVIDVSQIWHQAALTDPAAAALALPPTPVPIALTTVPVRHRTSRKRRTPESPAAPADSVLQLAWNF